jgi:hypothetical protein
VPPAAAFVAVAAVFATGVLVGGAAGAALLGLLAVFVALLLAAAWPRLRPSERGLRVLILLTVIAVAISVAR